MTIREGAEPMTTERLYERALLRRPGADLAAGLTTVDLAAAGAEPPDHDLALAQFAAYERALWAAGLETEVLPPLPGYPDAHFVEDTAVVLPEVAVIANPGAPARNGEQVSVADALAAWRPVTRIEAPGTLDGGDVLLIGRHALVGLSGRTNRAGAAQLGAVLETHGYTWETVSVGAGLHLKSSLNLAGEDLLLATAAAAALPAVARYSVLTVPPDEEYAANSLWLGGTVITPDGYPRVRDLIAATGVRVVTVDTGEFRKMDGGLTCLSLRF